MDYRNNRAMTSSVNTRATKRVREAKEELQRVAREYPQAQAGWFKRELDMLPLEGQVQRLWETLEDVDEENHALAVELAVALAMTRKRRANKSKALTATVRQLQCTLVDLQEARNEATQLRELLQLMKLRQARMEGSLRDTYREAEATLQRMNVDKVTGMYTFATE